MSVPLEKGAVMQRYESYKASGVEWLGDVPSHWDVKPLRAVTELKSDRNRPDLPVLSVYREYGVILKDSRDDNHNATSLDTSNYKVVKPGDLVVNKMKAWQGSMGVSAHEGIVSPAYITCSTNAERVQSNYLHYLLRSALLIGVYKALSYGVRVGQWDMHYEDFKQIPIPLPPLDMQDCIVTFLDQKTAEIDAAIGKKERLIELLQEQKNILVTKAVTCGLNPAVPMQVSEIDGIKLIPAHWNFVANRRIFREKAKKYCGEDLPPLSLSQKDGLIPTDDMKERSLKTSSFEHFRVCLKDDLVLNRFKAHLGVFFAAKISGVITFHYGIYTPKYGVSSKYYELLFHTNPFCEIYAGASNGMTVGLQNLSNQNFYDVKSILPPYGEQLEIVAYAESIEQKYNCLIYSIKEEINALLEMKKVIVSEAVLGRLKVPSLGKTKG